MRAVGRIFWRKKNEWGWEERLRIGAERSRDVRFELFAVRNLRRAAGDGECERWRG